MRLALIADVFPPLRSSGAVQLRDLSVEFVRQGHDVTMIVAAPELTLPWQIETWNAVRIVRLRTPRTKDTNYVRRTIGEFLMPFAMLRNLRKSPLGSDRWDGIVWYSPTIFLGPIVNALKKSSRCRSYLILRDIFPEWAVNMGLMGRGLPFKFFKAIANYQYSVADVIGIQARGDQVCFSQWLHHGRVRIEVLQNWLADRPANSCSIALSVTRLAGRKIFVYAGNMGIAQGMDILLDLAERMKLRADIGFLFVGRGSSVQHLRGEAAARRLDNVLFFDEIDPDEIPGLYQQCHVGLVTLDARHRTHNVPGKFVSYLQCGLPVLASINPGNDLVELIETERVGRVTIDPSVEELTRYANSLANEVMLDREIKRRCRALAAKLFSPEVAARQIVHGLQS